MRARLPHSVAVPPARNGRRVGTAVELRRVAVVRKISAVEQQQRRSDAKLAHSIAVGDPLSDRVLLAHREHVASAAAVEAVLGARKLEFRVVESLTLRLAAWADLVVTVGGDGTFLRASHVLTGLGPDDGPPMLGVNSATSSSVGYFCAATAASFAAILDKIDSGACHSEGLWRMQVSVNDTLLPVHVLNDVLLAHSVPAETSRYVLEVAGRRQDQKSSGIWVSTAAGSTGAMRAAGGRVQPLDGRSLQFRVREPMSWPFAGAPLVDGLFDDELVVTSRMLAGEIYLDGGHLRRRFGFGDRIRFTPSPRPMPWIAPIDVEQRRGG